MILGPFFARVPVDVDSGIRRAEAERVVYIWREPKRATLTAFYLWLLAAFVAGAIAGAAVASAFSGAPSTAHNTSGASSALTSAVDGGPVRAAHSRPADGRTPVSEADELLYSREPARTTPAMDGSTPASGPTRCFTAPVPTCDDPAPVLAARASPVPRSLVVAIGAAHGLDGEHFADVMHCESSLRPDAIGDGGRAVGIAQFHAPTWASSTRRYYGAELAPAMRLDPEIALEVAARKWAAEGPWAWTCAR